MSNPALRLGQLLDDVMNSRVFADATDTPCPDVYRIRWNGERVLVDIGRSSVTLDGETYTPDSDPSSNQAVVSIVGFVQGQLAMC